MSFFLRDWVSDARCLPGDVVSELVDILYSGAVPMITMCAVMVCIGGIIATRTADLAIWALVILTIALTLARLRLIAAYHRRACRFHPVRAEVSAWEMRYGLGSFAFGVLLGSLDARALTGPDPLVHMLVTGLIFAYGAGTVTRLSVRPLIGVGSLALAVVPTALGFAAHMFDAGGGHDAAVYAGQALLVVVMAVASLETMDYSYRNMLRQITTRRDLAHLAKKDVLTGLPNRLMLRERFERAIAWTQSNGALMGVLFVDLDGFKAVNDRFGHPTGDALIQAAVGRIVNAIRAQDTVARVGGDEFVVLQTQIGHPDEARLLANRLIRIISAPYAIDGQTMTIGASVGIALAPGDAVELDHLTSYADAALYQAKQTGRGRAVLWRDAVAGGGGTDAALTA